MYKTVIFMAVFSVSIISASKADLVWDGAPGGIGEQISSASAEFLASVSRFISVLEKWERGKASYDEVVSELKLANDHAIMSLEMFDEAMQDADKLVIHPEKAPRAVEFLRSRGINVPSSGKMFLEIAITEIKMYMDALSSAMDELTVAGELNADTFRPIALQVSNAAYRSLYTGILLSEMVAQ